MKLYIKIILLFLAFNTYSQNNIPFDTIYVQSITATEVHLGQFGSATLQIDDAGEDGLITRPLIVAEGFDSGLLGVENEFGENDITSFARSINNPDSDDLEDFLTEVQAAP